MAKRESQGLQIAIIVFVMVTVLFMVTTVLFWKKADTANTNADDDHDEYNERDLQT